MPLNLDYYYGNEAEQYSFYRIPKVLFTDPRYKPVSAEAKVLYGLLLDRMGLSVKNGWTDENGRVFVYFTLDDARNLMGCGNDKAIKLFHELDAVKGIGLIERKKQGQGRPTKIYVKNFTLPLPAQTSEKPKPEPEKAEVLTSEKSKSGHRESRTQDIGKTDCNNTEINHTDFNDTDLSIHPAEPEPIPVEAVDKASSARRWTDRIDEMDSYRTLVQRNIDYDILLQDHPYEQDTIDGYVELMLEVCCTGRKHIRINQDDVPTEIVRNRFLKLGKEHIEYVMDSLRSNTTKIGNIRAYTLSALYNAPVTISQYFTSLVSHDMANGFR